MDFSHSEPRRMLQESMSRFLRDHYAIDARHEFARADIGFSRANWSTFADLGLIGAAFSEEQGGFGGKGFGRWCVAVVNTRRNAHSG